MSNACCCEHLDTLVWENWIKGSSVLINIKDTNGRYIAASDAYAKFIGYNKAEEIVGKFPADIFSFKNAMTYVKQEKMVINTFRKLTFQNKFIHPEKGLLYIEGVKTPILNEKKVVVAVETVISDVTEKYLLINKLQHEQLKFKKFFNDIPVAVWIKDARNRFINVNKEFCEIFNVTKDEIVGQKYINPENLEGIMGEEEFAMLQAQDEFVLRGNKRHVFEFCTLNEGKKGCFKMIKIPIFRNGKVIGLVGCCHTTIDKKPM